MGEPYWITRYPNPWDAAGVTEEEWCAQNCQPEPTCDDYGHPLAAERDGEVFCYCGERRERVA